MKRLLYGIISLLFLLACTPSLWLTPTPRPTPTPSISSRILGLTNNFPWQERWRLVRNHDNRSQNVRNLITTKEGGIFTDTPWLKSVDATNGDLWWIVELEGWIDSITSDESLVYVVGNPIQGIAAYSLQTGELVWKSNITLPGHTGYYLRLQGKKLYIYESMDIIYVLDTKTGNLIEKFRISSIGQEPFSLLQLENGDIIQSDGKQLMLVQDEKIVWQTNLSGRPQKFPRIYDNMLIVRVENDRTVFDGIAGLDLETGKFIWQRVGEFFSNFVIADNLLYVISKEANILVIDPQTGKTVGSAQLLPDSVDTFYPVSALAANENMLYVYFYDSQELIAFERIDE